MRRILVFLLLLVGTVAQAQKFSFVNYTTQDGLPQSQVSAITQDNEGYLWIGTIGGLSRFNGGEFVTYSSKEGLLNNRITSLDFFEETIWVGHDGGISSIKNGKIKKYGFTGEDKSRPVLKIQKFNNRLIVSSNGGGLFELKGEALIKIDLGDTKRDRIRSGYVQGDQLYLATRAGVFTTKDLKTFTYQESYGDHSFSSITGNENELIFTTYDSLLIRKNLSTGAVVVSNPKHLTRLHGAYLEGANVIWLFGNEGVTRTDSHGNVVLFDESSGLPSNGISCLFKDSDDNIWMGSQGRGIFRFPGLKFEYFDQSTGYLSDLFMTGFQANNGDFYFGSFDKGIIHRAKNGVTSIVDIGTPNINIWASIKNVDGKNWFGTHTSLVSIDGNGEVKVFTEANTSGLPGEKIVSFTKINSRSMYVGGNDGVSIYRNGTFTKLGSRSKEYLGTVRGMEIVDGVLYCVSNLGMFVYRNNDFYPINDLDQVIYNIVADESGTLWIGSEGGLYFMKNGKIEQFILLENDSRANFIGFLNYKDKQLYVGTNNGLFVLSRLSGKIVAKRYGIGDGIPDLETNLNSGFFDAANNFWFGTSSGLVCFHTKITNSKVSLPRIRLKSMLLNYEPFDYRAYSNKVDENGFPITLEFAYNKNNIIFELDGISLINHDDLKYQFLLEGLSEEWSPLTSVSSITFTNLPAGEYVLHVRAVNIDGKVSKTLKMPFIIHEAFYKTWWFISLCALFLGLLIVLAFRVRVRRIQQLNENEMLEYKARLIALEQKSLNASMNRHFIFNSLNSIQYFINTRDRVSANKYLTNFAQLIRKNLDAAAWENNLIDLEEELARIELYLSLESMRFRDRFDYKIITNNLHLDQYKIPAMIMQPFVENSIIHGILPKEEVKGEIKITFSLANDVLEILIEDNGIGVNQSLALKGSDSGDHRSQGMEITSKRIELMQKLTDQDMKLIGPAEIIGDDGSINGTYVLLKFRVENLED